MDTKKIGFIFVFVFCCLIQPVFGGGFVMKNETFKAKEDVRYFTLEESKRLLKDLEELDILRKEIVIYKANETRFLEKIAKYEEAIEIQGRAIALYEKSIKALETETAALRVAVQECQKAISLQKDTIKIQERRERRNRWKQPIERAFWGAAGFYAGKILGGDGIRLKF